MPSSAARATFARVVPPCMPGEHRARVGLPPGRADARQAGQHARAAVVLGARGPARRARPGSSAMPELAAHPLEHRAGGEHAAVDRVLHPAVDAPGHGRQQAAGRLAAPRRPRGRARTRRCRRWPSRGPARRSRRRPARPAGPRPGRTAAARRARTRGAACRARRPCRAPRAAPRAARRTARTGARRSRACRAGAAGCARRWRCRWRSRRRAGRTGTSRPSPCAACRRRAPSLHRLVVLEQPGELGGREVGVERQAAERLDLLLVRRAMPVEHLLRALVLPDDDRAERRAGLRVPGEHRLALVVEPARDDLLVGAPSSSSADRLRPPRPSTSSPSCSTHPGCGWRLTLSRRASRTGLQPLVEQRGLDAGRSLVDAEHQP